MWNPEHYIFRDVDVVVLVRAVVVDVILDRCDPGLLSDRCEHRDPKPNTERKEHDL